MAQSRPIKMVVVGDGMVGKTCLLVAFTTGAFPGNDYEPTVFDNYAGSLLVDGITANLTLWDTAGQEDYEKLRPLSYPGSDVFLLCFSISSEASYNNILTKWQPELKHHCPTTPYVLVATKADLRQEPESPEALVSRASGKKLANKIKAYSYVECSAKTGASVKEVFEEAARAVLQPKPSKKMRGTCRLL
uniref:Ras-related C3 botulinum toxin substrate 1 n=2 Tax=Amblyomma TaxID=6942 RepID=G3MKS5_AMBMU